MLILRLASRLALWGLAWLLLVQAWIASVSATAYDARVPWGLAGPALAWAGGTAAAWLAWDAWTGNLTVNPIQAAEQRTGKYALILLVLSLACTPLNTLFGLRQALTVRRSLGLYAFMFAALHFTIFIWIDYGFNWEFIRLDLIDKDPPKSTCRPDFSSRARLGTGAGCRTAQDRGASPRTAICWH